MIGWYYCDVDDTGVIVREPNGKMIQKFYYKDYPYMMQAHYDAIDLVKKRNNELNKLKEEYLK